MRPITQPRRSCRKAWYWSGGICHSGYIANIGSGSTARFGKKLLKSAVDEASLGRFSSFFAGSEPPNQLHVATRLTPGTDWMRFS